LQCVCVGQRRLSVFLRFAIVVFFGNFFESQGVKQFGYSRRPSHLPPPLNYYATLNVQPRGVSQRLDARVCSRRDGRRLCRAAAGSSTIMRRRSVS
jgi:hypothetical protein